MQGHGTGWAQIERPAIGALGASQLPQCFPGATELFTRIGAVVVERLAAPRTPKRQAQKRQGRGGAPHLDEQPAREEAGGRCEPQRARPAERRQGGGPAVGKEDHAELDPRAGTPRPRRGLAPGQVSVEGGLPAVGSQRSVVVDGDAGLGDPAPMGLDRRPDGLVQMADEAILRAMAEEPHRQGRDPAERTAREGIGRVARAPLRRRLVAVVADRQTVTVDAARLDQPPDTGAPGGVEHLVGVECQDPVAPSVPERQVVRRPEIPGPGLADDAGAGGGGDLRCPIGGARVDHHDLVDDGPCALDARAEEGFLVARDDAQRDPHRRGMSRRRSILSRAVRAACRQVHRPRASALARSPRAFISAGWS